MTNIIRYESNRISSIQCFFWFQVPSAPLSSVGGGVTLWVISNKTNQTIAHDMKRWTFLLQQTVAAQPHSCTIKNLKLFQLFASKLSPPWRNGSAFGDEAEEKKSIWTRSARLFWSRPINLHDKFIAGSLRLAVFFFRGLISWDCISGLIKCLHSESPSQACLGLLSAFIQFEKCSIYQYSACKQCVFYKCINGEIQILKF